MSDPLPHSLDFAFSQGFDRDLIKARERLVQRLAGFEACEKWPGCQCSRACNAEPYRPDRGPSFWLTIMVMAALTLFILTIIIRGVS
ncbi:hypothetical protein JYU29_05820 [Tianweitania sp. BSSL-BM11]|uniref:Uncharacterized protein n=1 Tax=Tianweitania aestuarii TaxID=2814886 RepID=A0ABS5RT22_9HYPH|nr:hypothetical protein [Tianweitania aestuarii]MBS9720204.1 hypothetical protein [Tianweitania aestuarii]